MQKIDVASESSAIEGFVIPWVIERDPFWGIKLDAEMYGILGGFPYNSAIVWVGVL